MQVYIKKQKKKNKQTKKKNRNFSNKSEMRRGSWNQTGKSYNKNIVIIKMYHVY